MTRSSDKPHLVLVKSDRNNGSERLPDKLAKLRRLPARKKMDAILSDPAARELARAIPPTELYWTVQELGLTDALPLVELASPEQLQIFLDMELWDRWEFQPDQAAAWLSALLECGEPVVATLLPQLDPELLVLFLRNEIVVGGGIGDVLGDEERLTEWDHTFDDMFMITFLNKDHSHAIGTLLDIMYRSHHPLYVHVMEGVKNEIAAEVEDLAFQFRTGRLADLGFPSVEEATEIYAPLDPSVFTIIEEKEQAVVTDAPGVPILFAEGGVSLLRRVLPRTSDQVRMELNYLVNNAMVLEKWQEAGNVKDVFDRVHGWLNIALEHLSGGDEERALEALEKDYLKRLFRLGGGVIRRTVKGADGVTGGSPAAQQLLAGLRAKVPRFYCGLDADGRDSFREFSSLEDVQKVEAFLSAL